MTSSRGRVTACSASQSPPVRFCPAICGRASNSDHHEERQGFFCFYAGDAIENFATCASGSVPRAVASEAFAKDVLMERRSPPLAVLKDSLATARGTDSELVRTDRNLASPRPTFVQTLTAGGPG